MSKVFSEEKLNQLIDELEFTLKCIGQLKQDMNYYVAHDGYDISAGVMNQFILNKVKLDVEISTLKTYLEE